MDLIFTDVIRRSTDEREPWWDYFDVAEELTDCWFEILFDVDTKLRGNPADLVEFNEETWEPIEVTKRRSSKGIYGRRVEDVFGLPIYS
jgi:hypothetical protein